jgi:hypothetical protein
MKVIQLPDVLHEYLVHVIEKHAGSGIHPEEGLAVSKLWEAVTKQATHISDEQIAKMAAAGAQTGQSVPEAVTSHSEHEEIIREVTGH